MAAEDEEAQLLAAIVADPEDAQAREVYADWLDKRGDLRGEFVRLEAHLHAIPSRLAELAAQIDPVWLRRIGRHYDLVIDDAGRNKINIIKLVREVTGKGLKDAKDLVDAAQLGPTTVATDLERDIAEQIAERFKQAAATVRIVPHGMPTSPVPGTRGIMVTLASVVPEHKRVAINLVRELTGRGLRDAFRLVDTVLAGTPQMLATGVSIAAASELVAKFTPVGGVTCNAA